LVSIVLPVYKVEEYLAECLDSILMQDLASYEVIVVDDGSPDRSAAIARSYARRDRRIRLMRQRNAGLGAARNAGLRKAKGRYLMFVDSDDRLAAGALSALVRSCERSGSDIAVGSIVRFNSSKVWAPDWIPTIHSHDRIGSTAKDFPQLLRNNYSWGKVFRRSFWDECGLQFREGVAYEDQPVITQLYLRAASIDVLSATVYEYRARDDASSISQQTGTVKDLRDRASAWRVSREALLAEAPPEIYSAWLQTLFSTHFHWYLNNESVAADDEYWAMLQAAVTDLSDGAAPEIWVATPPERRVPIELARRGLREELLEFRSQRGKRTEAFPATVRPDGVLLHLPMQGASGPGLDDSLFLLHPDQLTARHHISRLRWVPTDGGEPCLRLEGHAYIPHLDLRVHRSEVVVSLRSETSGQEIRRPATMITDPALSPPGDADHADYAASVFTVDFPTGEILQGRPGEQWIVELEIGTAGFVVRTPVVDVATTGSAGLLESHVAPDGRRLLLNHRRKQPLRVQLDKPRAVVTAVELRGREVHGTVRPVEGRELIGIQIVTPGSGGAVHSGHVGPLSPDGTQSFALPVPALPDEGLLTRPVQRRWAVRAQPVRGKAAPLTFPSVDEFVGSTAGDDTALAVERTRRGNLGVIEWRTSVAVIDSAEVGEAGDLVVSGTFTGRADDLLLHVEGMLGRTTPVAVEQTDGRFTARLPLSAARGRFGELPLSSGKYWLECTTLGTNPVAVVVGRELAETFPRASGSDRLAVRLTRTAWGRLQVALLTPRGDAVRSRAAQAALATWSATLVPERFEGLLLRSYFGETATDNGIGLVRELRARGVDMPIRWAVKDFSVPVPDGVEPVVHSSREWYRLLRSSRYYMENMFQPVFHDKPEGQVLIQTFHGYPFKLMGHAHWEAARFARPLVEAYDRRAAQWDYVVSPAPYATPLLRREFRYSGEVLEIGYPRNDALLAPDTDDVRAEVRASLGIRDGETAVLYAPTFRDYVSQDNHKAALLDLLGMEALAAELGDEFVILNRSHAFNARSGDRIGSRGNLVDVTDYPEVTDLYLAADTAVVDYSSLRFDFGVTGKPMLFFVPDLERYREARGWIVDYEPTAPGPLLSERAEVVRELRDLDGVRARHQEAYSRFRRDYLSLEDGRASARLVDAVFVPRGDAPARDEG
jgi:CDP-glycerol glycerophosphotransferase